MTAGSTWQWTKSPSVFPASEGHTLTYYLVGPSQITITATTGTSYYSVTVAATATANHIPGVYTWVSRVSLAGVVHEVETGKITIKPNPATATAANYKSDARKALEVINAALTGRLTADIENYQIAGRAVSKIPILELKRLRTAYANEVYAEDHPGKLGIPVEFVT